MLMKGHVRAVVVVEVRMECGEDVKRNGGVKVLRTVGDEWEFQRVS